MSSSPSLATLSTFPIQGVELYNPIAKFSKSMAIVEADQYSSTSCLINDDDDGGATFYCNICMEWKQHNERFEVQPCLHSFCSFCMGNYVSTKVQENPCFIHCPNPQCNNGVLNPEVCKSIISQNVFDRWGLDLCEAALGSQKLYCPNRNCSTLLLKDEESCKQDDNDDQVSTKRKRKLGLLELINNNLRFMIIKRKAKRAVEMVSTVAECPYCHKLLCTECKVPWHDGITCKKFQGLSKNVIDEKTWLDIMLWKLAAKRGWKSCPKCKMLVGKKNGCSCIKCRCGHKFCYVCSSPIINLQYCNKCWQ